VHVDQEHDPVTAFTSVAKIKVHGHGGVGHELAIRRAARQGGGPDLAFIHQDLRIDSIPWTQRRRAGKARTNRMYRRLTAFNFSS